MGIPGGLIIASADTGDLTSGIAIFIASLVSSFSLWAQGAAMQWMAAMYDLASRGFEPEAQVDLARAGRSVH